MLETENLKLAMKKETEYLTTLKACRKYGVSPGYLANLARTGLLTPAKFGPERLDVLGRDRRPTLWLVNELESLVDDDA
jgi:hypothetical protein